MRRSRTVPFRGVFGNRVCGRLPNGEFVRLVSWRSPLRSGESVEALAFVVPVRPSVSCLWDRG